MRNVLVISDHANLELGIEHAAFDEHLYVNQVSPKRNLRLEIDNITHSLLQNLNDVSRDLLDIASVVYHADSSIRRGTSRDVFSEHWARKFTFYIPVRQPEIWNNSAIIEMLVELLEYLTEDRFEFHFVQRAAIPEQLVLKELSESLPYYPDADCVMLFSGGMDSLAGAVYLNQQGHKPILASHRSRPPLAKLQRDLARELAQRLDWNHPHLDVWISRMGTKSVEDSQRCRSFLFLALGALVANELGLDRLVVCENGITTFNLPRLGQTTGSMASRSTHPTVIELFQKLSTNLFGINLRVETPFLWRTRAEVMAILIENNYEDLFKYSVSCNHARRPKIYPHCGTCSQCVDRQFSEAFNGLDREASNLRGYEKDIFVDALSEGKERMQVTSPFQFALGINKNDRNWFLEEYGQVFDAIESLPGDAETNLQKVYDLHARFAREIINVMANKTQMNYESLINRELPDTCLLMLAGLTSQKEPDWKVSKKSRELQQKLHAMPSGNIKPYEELIEDILTFLFCDSVASEYALKPAQIQVKSDQGYERRDLLFENQATSGFWANVKREYNASGIIADAKNYKKEINGDIVRDFASKYLKSYGVGSFGIIVARKVPSDVNDIAGDQERISSAVNAQKQELRDNQKMILLLEDADLQEMLNMKENGLEPTGLLSRKIFLLRSRM